MRDECVRKIIMGRKYKLEIILDDSADSPRDEDYDNLGTMVCFHRRYNLGDNHNFESPDDFLAKVKKAENIILPLYLYDHSGITISTKPFSCQWDSGQVGWIYCSKGRYGMTDDEIKKVLEEEVKLYDQYITGEVFGYVLYKKVEAGMACGVEWDARWEEDDSCWGFFGDNWMENGIADNLTLEVMDDLKGGR